MAQVPTVQLKGPRGMIVVNEIDAKKWIAKGYTLVDEKTAVGSVSSPLASGLGLVGRQDGGGSEDGGSDNDNGDED